MPQIPGTELAFSTRKIAVSVLGAVLIAVGVAALVLPGPGLLMILAGLVVLATEFEWAARRVDWMRVQALGAAEVGVATVPRIIGSALSAVVVMGAGVVWGLNPRIPQVWISGPHLPFGGWRSGAVIIVGGVIALVLLAYSIKRFRVDGDSAPTQEDLLRDKEHDEQSQS